MGAVLVEEAGAHGVGPRPVPLLRLRGEAEGHDGPAVLLRVSIGDNLDLPVEGRGLAGDERHTGDRERGQLVQPCYFFFYYFVFSFVFLLFLILLF